jgi:hypothetical protein
MRPSDTLLVRLRTVLRTTVIKLIPKKSDLKVLFGQIGLHESGTIGQALKRTLTAEDLRFLILVFNI